jgi:prepilin signal peptidase PulO-like enzyme (type II secretory pathway)
MGSIFAILAYAGMQIGIDIMSIEMVFLLFFWFVTGVYILYDLKYMEIPDQIMVPAIYILLLIPFLSLLFVGYNTYSFHIFPIPTMDRIMWAVILYTFFYLQILIPGSIFLIKNKDYKNILHLIGSYFTFPIMILVDIFRKKNEDDEVEIPTWIGWWDLRVAIFIGLTLGTIHGVVSLGIAYIFWSIIWVTILLINAIKKRKTQSQIPFWPFLGFGWIMAILFYPEIYIFFKII